MKRELKAECSPAPTTVQLENRKAHPDEKGTESIYSMGWLAADVDNRKAHPDEKGTESVAPGVCLPAFVSSSQGPSR